MSTVQDKNREADASEKLATCGLRSTPQRRHIYNVLMKHRDHPTAEEVFMRAKGGLHEISMATVYNCLDALVKSGLVRQVNLDRTATRYCPNMSEHCHFHCNDCGRVFDVNLTRAPSVPEAKLPPGFRPEKIDVSMRGPCPDPGCPSHTE